MKEFYVTINNVNYFKKLYIKNEIEGTKNIFKKVLISPLIVQKYSELKTYPLEVMFDSGGYTLQQNKISPLQLLYNLINVYSTNAWGYRYVLPDFPQLSQDSPELQNCKSKISLLMTDIVYNIYKKKYPFSLVPVVHGNTLNDVNYFLESYEKYKISTVGFGGFDTANGKSGYNVISKNSINKLQKVYLWAKERNISVHAFGVGGGKSLFKILPYLDTYDTSAWDRSAGYNEVYIPYEGRVHIGKSQKWIGHVTDEEYYTKIKNHKCPFCKDLDILKKKRINRALHNLYVTYEQLTGNNNEM